jgi:hypothetical protein
VTAAPGPAPALRIAAVKRQGRRLKVTVAASGSVARVRARLLRRGAVVTHAARTGAGRLTLKLPRRATGRFRLSVHARGATAASRTLSL